MSECVDALKGGTMRVLVYVCVFAWTGAVERDDGKCTCASGFVHDVVVDDHHDGDKWVNLHTYTHTAEYMCTLTHVNKRDAAADAAQAILCLVALFVGGRLSIGQPIKICTAGVANNIHEQYIILRVADIDYICTIFVRL